jgi:adenylate cyclase
VSISAATIRAQVRKLLASPQLAHSDGLAKLLCFLVQETLHGRGDQLKETRLGLEVFGRPLATYDAAIDPIVRVQMGRLRQRLHDYYAHGSEADRVIIDIPKGRYTPIFMLRGNGAANDTVAAAARTRAPEQRIAVLPFVNMSEEPGREYFSDGLTEELINLLARDSRLQVVARTSTFQFKQQARDVREIGRQLDVGTILEGSVRQSGSRVRITAHLISVADGCHLWSERFERELTDIFLIHDEIAAAIHVALHARLSADHAPAQVALPRRARALDAYNHYLLGRCLWNNRTAQGLRAALAHFSQAVQLDHQFTRAYAGMADCHLLLALSGAEPPERSMPAANDAARRSLEFDPNLAEAHTSLAAVHRIYERDRTSAEAAFRRSQALDPSYATARHWNGLFNYAPMRRHAEAVEELERAADLDPLAVPIIADLGLVHCFAGHHEQATIHCRRALELAPHFHRPHWFLGLNLATQGDCAAAEEMLRRALALCPDEAFRSRVIGTLGFCYGRWNKKRQADAQLRELRAMAAHRYVPRWDVAQIHAGLGDAAATLDELEAAAAAHESYAVFTPVWPTLRAFRSHARFRRIASTG